MITVNISNNSEINEDAKFIDMIDKINSSIDMQNNKITPYYSNNSDSLEKYFYKFYIDNISQFNTTGYTFIPIYWTNIYKQIAKGDTKIKLELEEIISKIPKNKKYFTVSQHDDAPKQNLPFGTINFSAGGNSKNTITIPLICDDDLNIYNLKKTDKDIFCSFVGSLTHPCRKTMLETLTSQKDYKFILKDKWTSEISASEQINFINFTKRSKFTLCPRGYGATSWRLYEAMQLQSVPVYIYDKLHLPYQNEINWNDICVLIHVDDIEKIDEILKSISDERYNIMVNNIKNIYPIFFNLDYMCHYILNSLKNYNKSSRILSQKTALENKIYQQEDEIFSTFKCETVKKIYTTYSNNYNVFTPWFNTIYNIYPNVEINKILLDDNGQAGIYKKTGWTRIIKQKLQKIIEIFDDPNESFFVYADNDIQFFKPFHEEITNYLKDYDIVFQDDITTACAGFFFCRKTCKVKKLFEMALKNMISRDSETYSDQNSINDILKNMPEIKYTKLPENFYTVGFSTKKQVWSPETNFDLPLNIIMHHANYTIGHENKLKLLQTVKDKHV